MYGERGDLAEFGKKRNVDYDFPPLLYVGGKKNKRLPLLPEIGGFCTTF